MRSLVRRTLILSSCAVSAMVASGCEGKKVTEYVPGISTQVTVPRDLKAIRVDINIDGVNQFCEGYKAYEGKVLLPRSLGDYTATGATLGHPVSYVISGVATDDLGAQVFASCGTVPKVGTDQVRVLRRSTQPFQENEILFLPMPLKYSCFDKDCPEDQTCKGGLCVSAALTPGQIAQLVPFSSDLVDGTGGTCFHAKECVVGDPAKGLQAALPAVQVDPDKCIYAVAGTKSAPAIVPGAPNPVPPNAPTGDGVNVQISYDGGLVHEVLDLDPEEGFSTPDPANPQRFQLAPGLCQMVHGVDDKNQPTPHRITSIFASPTCRAKTISQPFCADDQLAAMGLDPQGVAPNLNSLCSTTELKPPQAGLMVVVDDSTANSTFFTSLKKSATSPTIDPNDPDSAIATAVKAALSDPAFEHTDVGLVYAAPDAANQCSATNPPAKPLGPATTQRDVILNELVGHIPTVPVPHLGAALQRAYAPLQVPNNNPYFRRAVLVLTDAQDFAPDAACVAASSPPDVAGTAAGASAPVRTYVMQLTKNPPKPTGVWALDTLANKGGSQTAAYQSEEGSAKFEEIVNYLATCVYEVPDANAPKQGDSVAFTSPLTGQSTTLAFNDNCKTPETGTGAGFGAVSAQGKPGTTQVNLCADSCAAYRNVLDQTTKFTALYQQPPLAVPVYAYHNPDASGACK